MSLPIIYHESPSDNLTAEQRLWLSVLNQALSILIDPRNLVNTLHSSSKQYTKTDRCNSLWLSAREWIQSEAAETVCTFLECDVNRLREILRKEGYFDTRTWHEWIAIHEPEVIEAEAV